MRLTIVVLVLALAIGASVISVGFLTNQGQEESKIIAPYERLQNYKEELEKINQYNQKILEELKQNIADSDVDLELQEEIKVLEKVISDNKAELEEVIQKLSEMKPDQ